ncbi:hypothetical protein D3C78_1916370 [compost metagenome]
MLFIAKLLAEGTDIDLHDIFLSAKIISPYLVQNHRLAQYKAMIDDQVLQQLIFGRG